MTLKKTLTIVGLVLFIGTLAAPILIDQTIVRMIYATWKKEALQSAEKDLYKHLEAYQKDLEIIKPKLDFLQTQNTKDAGPFLNPRVKWDFLKKQIQEQELWKAKIDASKNISLSPESRKILFDAKENFLDIDPTAFANENTEWLSELRNYDHWNIDKNSPVDFFKRYNFESPFLEFEHASIKVHLLKAVGRNEDAYALAILDVLHYGKLCLTTETLVGQMIFATALQNAAVAVSKRPQIRTKLGEWNALIDEHERVKKVLWAVNQFTGPRLGMKTEILKEVFQQQSSSTGLCASIREHTQGGWVYWQYFNDVLPEEARALQELITENQKGCRLTWIKEKTPPWTKLPEDPNSPYSAEYIEGFSSSPNNSDSMFGRNLISFFDSWLPLLPNSRKFYGSILLSIAVPNFTERFYGDKKSIETLDGSEPSSDNN